MDVDIILFYLLFCRYCIKVFLKIVLLIKKICCILVGVFIDKCSVI